MKPCRGDENATCALNPIHFFPKQWMDQLQTLYLCKRTECCEITSRSDYTCQHCLRRLVQCTIPQILKYKETKQTEVTEVTQHLIVFSFFVVDETITRLACLHHIRKGGCDYLSLLPTLRTTMDLPPNWQIVFVMVTKPSRELNIPSSFFHSLWGNCDSKSFAQCFYGSHPQHG